LLDPIWAGCKHYCHPERSEGSAFRTRLRSNFSAARYCSSSSCADESAAGLFVVSGFVAAVFAGGDFGFADAVCAPVGAFLLCGVFATVRYLRILFRRFGPIPLIASRSSTLLNAPYDFRISRILSAVEGPIPGTCCNSAALAKFKLIGCTGGFFLARTTSARQRIRRHESKQSTRRQCPCNDITI